MHKSPVLIAIEKSIRDQLALTDQPREALVAIARELFAALDSISDVEKVRGVEALDLVRLEFSDAFARVWRDYGGDGLPPPICGPRRAQKRRHCDAVSEAPEHGHDGRDEGGPLTAAGAAPPSSRATG